LTSRNSRRVLETTSHRLATGGINSLKKFAEK